MFFSEQRIHVDNNCKIKKQKQKTKPKKGWFKGSYG